MSDIRFIMIGVVVITIGFIFLGVIGSEYTGITVQTNEFSTCYEYPDDQLPVEIDCDEVLQDKTLVFTVVAIIISAGVLALIKGVKGTWDKDVKPEAMPKIQKIMMMNQITNFINIENKLLVINFST